MLRGAIFIKFCENNNNITELKNQEGNFENIFLDDKLSNGKIRPWKEKKLKSLELGGSYKRLQLDNKFIRNHQCGNFLEFKRFDDGSIKLKNMHSCQLRLCAMCAWRRELKIFNQVSKVISSLNSNGNYRFLFLTLTCKNVSGDELAGHLDLLFKAFKRFSERKIFEKAIKGWFRALEVTHDVNRKITEEMYKGDKNKHLKPRKKYYDSLGLCIGDNNPNFDMYHPHFHLILMVGKSYFNNNYISQEKWTSLWKESLRCDYTPIVHVQTFKGARGKEVAEVSKYTVKDTEFLVKNDSDLTDKTVLTLDDSLAYRRLVAFGGLLKDEHRKLNLSDIEDDSDLVHIDNDGEVCNEIGYVLEHYRWNVGYSNYVRFEFD